MPPTHSIALISGANTGIGLATATQLAKTHNYHVIIGSRNAAAGKKAAAALVADGCSASSIELDLLSDSSISAAASTVEREFGMLDVLINNAGICIEGKAVEGGGGKEMMMLSQRKLFNQTMGSNLIGAACLTEACLPLLRKAEVPRVVFVSSRLGSASEATNKETIYYSTDYRAYDCSKAALNMLALNWARILEGDGGLVNAVCPGLVKTKLTNFHEYGSSTEVGAQRIVELATAEKGSATATFSDRDGGIPW